jgi:Putative collagen-binding domain of a collagenase
MLTGRRSKYILLSFAIIVIFVAAIVVAQYRGKLLKFVKARVISFKKEPVNAAMAKPGLYYLAYVQRNVHLDLTAVLGVLNYEWYDPRTGKTVASGQIEGGAMRSFSPPDSGDFVLWVRAANSIATSAPTRHSR